MTSTNFKENEKVYAFDGPWIYPATILKIHSNDNKTDRRIKEYRIHYNDWSNEFDEDVLSERLLKINHETRKIWNKLEAQSEIILYSNNAPAENILQVEGKVKKFDKGDRIIVFSEWLLHKGYVIDVKLSKRYWRYCIRYMFTKIHYEDWIKSGEYRISKVIRDDWVTSDKLFKYTDACNDIEKKLLRYRKLEDDLIIQQYFESQEKICKNVNESKATKDERNKQYSDIDKDSDVTIMSNYLSGSSDIVIPLKGRAPKETGFLTNLQHNSTML